MGEQQGLPGEHKQQNLTEKQGHLWNSMSIVMQVNGSAFQASYATIQQQNMTYDNSGNAQPHTYTYTSEFAQARPSQWSHAAGLDAYAGPNVSAGIPQLLSKGKSNAPAG